MKRYNLFGLLFLLLLGGCSYLDDYSQDLVVAKNVEHLDELMIGSCYFQSNNITQMGNGEVAWFLNILDDDVTTVAVEGSRANSITEMNNQYYGYTTWQYEVGRSWNKSSLRDDAGTWNALYQQEVKLCSQEMTFSSNTGSLNGFLICRNINIVKF